MSSVSLKQVWMFWSPIKHCQVCYKDTSGLKINPPERKGVTWEELQQTTEENVKTCSELISIKAWKQRTPDAYTEAGERHYPRTKKKQKEKREKHDMNMIYWILWFNWAWSTCTQWDKVGKNITRLTSAAKISTIDLLGSSEGSQMWTGWETGGQKTCILSVLLSEMRHLSLMYSSF